MSDLRLPPERFYWAALETGALPPAPPGSHKRRRRMGYLFEAVLPIPVESVHAAYVPAGEGRVIACGMDADALSALRWEGWATLGPAALPAALAGATPSPDANAINLLTGAFEPPAVRAARRRWAMHAAGLIILAVGLLVAGAERRTRAARLAERQALAATSAVYDAVLPPAGPGAQPAHARFASELRSLQSTRRRPGDAQAIEPVAETMAMLLARWPGDTPTQTDAITVGQETMSLAVTLPDSRAAQALIAALGTFEGWSVAQDSVTPERAGVRLRRAWAREVRP